MIFGIFGKFRIDIDVPKNIYKLFSRWKFSRETSRHFFRDCFLKMFEKYQHFIGISMISFIARNKGIIEIPIEFLDFHQKVLNFSKKTFWKFFWTPMSIRNFPRIPKITLRKSSDHFKDTKNPNYENTFLIYWIFDDLRILLCGATLNLFKAR